MVRKLMFTVVALSLLVGVTGCSAPISTFIGVGNWRQ